jgi:hypothetical protein
MVQGAACVSEGLPRPVTPSPASCLNTLEVRQTPSSVDAPVPVNGAGGAYGNGPAQGHEKTGFDGAHLAEGARSPSYGNTYRETTPGLELDPFLIGPDRDHVRLVPNS